MQITEYNPGGPSSSKSLSVSAADADAREALLLEALPAIFHKLKNKLTPILGFTQILKARGADDFARERLERIERNASDLAGNLNALKEFSCRRAAPLRPAALDRLLAEMGDSWQALADAAQSRVVVQAESGLPELPLDRAKVRVLLLELASNAARALRGTPPPEREIRVSLRRCGGALRLAVRDNGRGMTVEEQDQAWNPFCASPDGGAGLGLVLCEAAIAGHGASRTLASVPGEFSEFGVDFPLAAAPGAGPKKANSIADNPKEAS